MEELVLRIAGLEMVNLWKGELFSMRLNNSPLISHLKKLRGRFDLNLIVVVFISMVAIWPFISRASLPQDTDAELHIFRLAELSFLVRNGAYFPRWAPNFYHGYGYPIFNYYAPLSYYVGLIVELLPRLDAVAGTKAVFVLGLLLAAWGTFGFVRDNWGTAAGFVATAVYIYAPYVQFIDPHARGALAESFSLGVFPMALWMLDRLRREQTALRWLAAVSGVTAVILSHNLMALLFFSILAAWVAWQHLLQKKSGHGKSQILAEKSPKFRLIRANSRKKQDTRIIRLLIAALLLGVGIAAIFWLVVALERNEVNLNTLLGQGDNYDFHTHFLTWRELLAPSSRLDWGASAPILRFNLGIAQWMLGGLGLFLTFSKRVIHRKQALFFVATLVILLFLMTSLSAVLWENIPFLPFFQFPWRLLGAANFMLAVLAGVGTAVIIQFRGEVFGDKGRFTLQARGETAGEKDHSALPATPPAVPLLPISNLQSLIPALFIALPILLSLPLSQPLAWPDFGPVTRQRMTEIEMHGRWLGTTSTADYVPVTVDIVPRRNEDVVAGFFEEWPLDRVNRIAMPDGAIVESSEITALHFRYAVTAPKDFRLRLYLFDFPGWQVQIDGQPVETELARPDGFIIVLVPKGQHQVDVKFGTTPARTLALVVTLFSLALVLWVARSLVINKQLSVVSSQYSVLSNRSSIVRSQSSIFSTVLLITILFVFILNPLGVLHDESVGLTAVPASNNTFADFGQQIALIGYDTDKMEAQSGDWFNLMLYWKAERPLDINYQSFVHILDASGTLIAQSDSLNPGEFPTRRWSLEKYVRDSHTIQLPPDIPPGEYSVMVGLWVQAEGWRLPLLDTNQQQTGDTHTLFTLHVP